MEFRNWGMGVGRRPTWSDFGQIFGRNPSFVEACSRKDTAQYEVNHAVEQWSMMNTAQQSHHATLGLCDEGPSFL